MGKILASSLLVGLIIGLNGCTNTGQQAKHNQLPVMSESRLQAHMEFLADDSLKGRQPGTEGYDIAANYVAAQFKMLGLKPGGDDDSYLQKVAFHQYNVDRESIQLSLHTANNQESFKFGDDFTLLVNPNFANVDLSADLIWAGFGLDAPELAINSYKNIDVKGKIVVLSPSIPSNIERLQRNYYGDKRQSDAIKHGAAAVLTLGYKPRNYDEKAKAQAKQQTKRPPYPTPKMEKWKSKNGKFSARIAGLPVSIRMGYEATLKLMSSINENTDDIYQQLKNGVVPELDLSSISLNIAYQGTIKETYTSHNVVSILPGSDEKLADEYVVLTAHLDHLGFREHIKNEDKIFNGLMDNASGVASILEMAHQFKTLNTAPKRSIIFIALTNEETGLQGADYFAKNPTVLKSGLVANVNVDMPILTYDFADVVAFGAEHSNLGSYVESATAKMQISLSPDPIPKKNLFFRSDHFRFVQQGIPSIMLMTGFTSTTPETIDGKKMFWEFYGDHYHKPSDDVHAPILWDVAAKFTQVNWLIANEIANSPITPHWNENSFFEQAYKTN